MIYYNKNDILIRDLAESDVEILAHQEQLQGLLDKKTERNFQIFERKCQRFFQN